MSSNQRHKKYIWRNQQLSEVEWKEKMSAINLGSFSVFDALYREFKNQIGTHAVWPENFNERTENSTGEYLKNCVNVKHSWFCDGAKDSAWTLWGNLGTERVYLGCDPGSSDAFGNMIAVRSSQCRFSWVLNACVACEYCVECQDCENCFGCVGLKRKKFHIFNRPYSEEEYFSKLDGIKCAMLERGEYGQALPGVLMQTPFQHSGGVCCFDYSKDEQKALQAQQYEASLDNGFGDWTNRPMRSLEDLPDSINDIQNDWIGVGIMDPILKRPYSIHPMELELYKRLRLPIRREHFIKRVEDLWQEMNKVDVENRSCETCHISLIVAVNSTYPHRRVFCKNCYTAFIERN